MDTNHGHKGHTMLVVGALWEKVNFLCDWEGLLILEMLLLDHSVVKTGSSRKRARVNGKMNKQEEVVDEAWRLEEDEESVLLEVLVASLRRAKVEATGSKKVSMTTNQLYLVRRGVDTIFLGR